MTIDEAIKKYKDITNTDANCPRHCVRPCEVCAQGCKQVLEWLEDYKQIKMLIPIEQALKNEYNKAIDDFMNAVRENQYLLSDKINSTDYGMFTCGINEIAEQLKAGAR